MSLPVSYKVEITLDAQADLEDIYDYIAEHDSQPAAEHVIDKIEAAGLKLSVFPEKGSVPAELLDLGIRDYRQTSWKAYRLIYRIVDAKVYIYVIGDGRQDFRTLLMRRLLSA
ncbi:type II toxin-antitoxin system RelE/ParE family toxin [Roseateles saccharophilus]|uniref:Toxin ParE1/3/4 n=1 Tax=Roseateles saccharophilus TaxID=304 RepID=A0A4R3UG70_ROSSA|nr:type II toxin-antitoxin system RelE/ParE family toxin [Roseateles saccharophilus]MDG0835249.1 type II toxin-antitoxin system RelE/ParE family toxin [Roseateles saccharophilus]TCU86859.1 toxin ParE1/3/4 [Roseateles saccharophilus]